MIVSSPPSVLTEAEATAAREAHAARADALTAGHRDRKRHGEAHPIEDFLFTYYPFTPGRMRQWHPGRHTAFADPHHTYPTPTWYVREGDVLRVDVDRFLAEKGTLLREQLALLRAVAGRPAAFGCFGLHEWAMAYHLQQGEQRHSRLPLRLGEAGTDRVVDSHRIRCTHVDAFRFFAPDARGLNQRVLTRDDQLGCEQGGCLHANMDLYRITMKLLPLVPSSLALDCFELARDIRYLDMEASPYDVRVLGLEPVAVETDRGKAEYVRRQREFSARADALRREVLSWVEPLVEAGP